VMRFFIRLFYLDGSGKEIGYWSNFKSSKEMMDRFDELGIGIDKVLQLMIRKNGESEYRNFDPTILGEGDLG
jgi:hypothetical protein